MPRGERPLENGPLREFAAGLRELRIGAGSPTYRELSASNYGTVFDWPTDEAIRSRTCPSATMLPQDWDKWFPGIDYRSPC